MTDISPVTPRFRDAYNQLTQEIQRVPDSELIIINIDVPTAVTTVLGALPEIRNIRKQVVTDMPTFDIERFDKLENYTLALGHAHTLYLAASSAPEPIEALAQSAATTRELLLSDATALAQRGLMNGQRLKELKGPVGYRNLAFDLFTLATVLRDNLPTIAGKTALQPAELDQAETIADRLLTAVGIREQAPAVIAETTDNRQRAFALFMGAYDHTRRAVSFLRWTHEDLDEIAPSLYAGRGNTRRKPEPVQLKAATPTTPAPVVQVPNGQSTPANTPNTHASEVGFPEAHPFANQ